MIAQDDFEFAVEFTDSTYIVYSKNPTNLPLIDFRLALKEEDECVDASSVEISEYYQNACYDKT